VQSSLQYHPEPGLANIVTQTLNQQLLKSKTSRSPVKNALKCSIKDAQIDELSEVEAGTENPGTVLPALPLDLPLQPIIFLHHQILNGLKHQDIHYFWRMNPS
jgi:hypothetical protein